VGYAIHRIVLDRKVFPSHRFLLFSSCYPVFRPFRAPLTSESVPGHTESGATFTFRQLGDLGFSEGWGEPRTRSFAAPAFTGFAFFEEISVSILVAIYANTPKGWRRPPLAGGAKQFDTFSTPC
jgi:hypothetical protein